MQPAKQPWLMKKPISAYDLITSLCLTTQTEYNNNAPVTWDVAVTINLPHPTKV